MLTKKTVEPVMGTDDDWRKADTVDGGFKGWRGERLTDYEKGVLALEGVCLVGW